MTSTGSTIFDPIASDLVLNAFSRIQITGSQITSEHMRRAEAEANLAQVKFANKQPNLWTSELITQALTSGVSNYALPARVITLIIVYMTTTSGGVTQDRVLSPLSSSDYASQPNKTTSGAPTSYWFNRLKTPEITLWPVPDALATYTLNLRVLRQIHDVSAKFGFTLDLPYRWLDAFGDELTARLARHFRPEQFQVHNAVAAESWRTAATEDIEDVPIHIQPMGMGRYYQ